MRTWIIITVAWESNGDENCKGLRIRGFLSDNLKHTTDQIKAQKWNSDQYYVLMCRKLSWFELPILLSFHRCDGWLIIQSSFNYLVVRSNTFLAKIIILKLKNGTYIHTFYTSETFLNWRVIQWHHYSSLCIQALGDNGKNDLSVRGEVTSVCHSAPQPKVMSKIDAEPRLEWLFI